MNAIPYNNTASPLYTREILGAAMRLADFPLNSVLALQNEMRSQTCGSMVNITMSLNGDHVHEFGIAARACALGQASAALLAQHICGRSLTDVKSAEAQLSDYLHGRSKNIGNWPNIAMLMPARDYPARRDSVLLPWHAVIDAMEKGSDCDG